MPLNPKAARWCAYGAMWKVFRNYKALEDAVDVLRAVVGDTTICSWNDESTHEEVIRGFDLAIEREMSNAERNTSEA